MSAAFGWAKESPTPKEYLDGNSLKVAYYFNNDLSNTAVKYTENPDWDETPFNVARVKMPMKDGVFTEKLNGAYPF
ncbi:hypothetical protein Pcac1_g21079 [Phytophthora cactorum]|nr:hypothetical protein Pcac1_g21079 [Phytophthora cactorum]KAG3039124.1 hypothetical protein PC121_g23790 [Phytophthora cactorum]